MKISPAFRYKSSLAGFKVLRRAGAFGWYGYVASQHASASLLAVGFPLQSGLSRAGSCVSIVVLCTAPFGLGAHLISKEKHQALLRNTVHANYKHPIYDYATCKLGFNCELKQQKHNQKRLLMKSIIAIIGLLWLLLSACSTDSNNEATALETYMNRGVRIVVLGSSTAQGMGTTRLDSAWVYRLRHVIKRQNPRNTIVNLARGGYTSNHILPSQLWDTTAQWQVDTSRNLSKAIALHPDFILINLPSNDMTRGVPLAQQFANWRIIDSVLQHSGIPFWVTSCQPVQRSSAVTAQQLQLNDSLKHWFAEHYVDFWSGLASAQGRLLPFADSGDGIHLNDSAHRVIAARMVSAGGFDDLLGNYPDKTALVRFDLKPNLKTDLE